MHLNRGTIVDQYRGFQILQTDQGDLEAFNPERRVVLSYEDTVDAMKRRIDVWDGVHRPTTESIPELG